MIYAIDRRLKTALYLAGSGSIRRCFKKKGFWVVAYVEKRNHRYVRNIEWFEGLKWAESVCNIGLRKNAETLIRTGGCSKSLDFLNGVQDYLNYVDRMAAQGLVICCKNDKKLN